jgi:hypothetical protein
MYNLRIFVEVLINTIPVMFDRKIYNLPILLKESSCLPNVNELHTYYIKRSRQYYMTTMSPPTLVWRHIVFAIFQLYRGGQFYRWRKLEYPEKTTDLPEWDSNSQL